MNSFDGRTSFSSAPYQPDQLVMCGDALAKKVTLLAGQNIVRGTVLGKITASGKYVESLAASADGSEVPDLIAVEDLDATAGDKDTMAYARGDFNANQITLGAGHTLASVEAGLRTKDIYLITPSVSA